MRIAMAVEYNGRQYAGWQRQKHSASIQEAVETALAKVADHDLTVHCAGRTDAGVHALQQVIHFDSGVERPNKAWVYGGNSHLPPDIRFLWAVPVDNAFDARRSAVARQYRYLLLNRKVQPGIQHQHLTWYLRPLDEKIMAEAATVLIGEHDFSAFRGSGCQSKSPMRRVDRMTVTRYGDIVAIEVVANAFLLHMVRNIVGVLTAVGCGDHLPVWVRQVLESKDRRVAGVTAPAAGLSLLRVYYPQDYSFPDSQTPFVVLGGGGED